MRSALGVENFHGAITFATQTTSSSRRISQNPSLIDANRVSQAKCSTRRCPSTRNNENDDFSLSQSWYFTLYNESDVTKRFSRQSRSYLPLRSCLYDASISSYRRSKFSTLQNSLTTSLDDDCEPNTNTVPMRLLLTYLLVWCLAICRGRGRGLALRANLESDFKCSYLENG